MPTYRITSPEGMTIKMTGERPPTEGEIQAAFASVQPAEKGFIGRVGERLGERAEAIGREPITPESIATMRQPLRVAGQVAGGVGDIFGEAMKSGYGMLPERAQETIERGVGYLAGTEPGQQAIGGAASLAEFYGRLDPEMRKDIEAGANLAMMLPMLKGAQVAGRGAGRVAREAVAVPKDIARAAVTKAIPATAEERLYQSAFKMPLTKKWKKELPGKTISAREAATRIGLEEGIMPTKLGEQKLKNIIDVGYKQIDDIIKPAAAKGDIIKTEEVIKRLDDVKQKFIESVAPDEYIELLDNAAMQFRAHGKTIPVDKAMRIKRNTYRILRETSYGEVKGATVEARKALARGVKEEIDRLYPGIKILNEKSMARIKLQDAMDAALGRISQRDLVGLATTTAMAGGKGGPLLAIVKWIIDQPQIKARVGIALRKARKTKPKSQLFKSIKEQKGGQ